MAHHHHSGAPLLELNETEIARWHSPAPPSYFTVDWDGAHTLPTRYPGLIVAHAVLMSLAFFVALPLGIAMRSVKHRFHWISKLCFFTLWGLGDATSSLYRKRTPNMYEGSVHGRFGSWVFWLAVSIEVSGLLGWVGQTFQNDEGLSLSAFKSFLSRSYRSALGYASVVADEPEELQSFINKSDTPSTDTAQWIDTQVPAFTLASPSTATCTHIRTGSDDTLHILEEPMVRSSATLPLLSLVKAIRDLLERTFVLVGFAELLVGVVVYTGGCRGSYINGCLAHLIKGGVFWCYGLFSFARYLGSFSEYGWSWNQVHRSQVSAEFVESALIFIYGCTNVWMERLGASPNDPFTTKQIQHISIALMFWLAGLVAMAIESETVRSWMGSLAFQAPPTSKHVVQEPPTYTSSFNPFPALVVGVTGVSMAAHAQTYLFQVQIHSLWGNMLLAAAVLRCMTYFFVWISPPTSILPSRPPTEALVSFFLACGGLMFMFSTEELTIAAMRHHYDDQMMFTNVAVAITCIALCWTVGVVGFKGWLVSRQQSPRRAYAY